MPKGTSGARKVTEESAKYYCSGIPGFPPKKRFALASDKRVSQKLMTDLIERGERGAAGMPEKNEAGRLLEPLVTEFGESLARKSGAKHVQFVLLNVRRVLAGCRMNTLADLRAADAAGRAEAFVWSLLGATEAMSSPNAAYVGKHARQFTRWCWRKRKLLDHDPLAGMDLPSQETEGKRRALSAEELARLIDAAQMSDRDFRGLYGSDRAALYLLAASTGYRVQELAALTPAHLDLDADVPVVRLKGKSTKDKKDAEQPIPAAVVTRLRPLVAGRRVDTPLWPGSWWERSNDMFTADLEAAGVPVEVNEEVATFHSLRHTFTTLLGRSAPLKVVQELARHSTPVLTIGRYSHAALLEKAEAVGKLPLPGSAETAGPFAHLTRPQLEQLAGGLVVLLSSVTSVLLSPPCDSIAPKVDTTGTVLDAMERRRRGVSRDVRVGDPDMISI